jgi:TorA maturation chaperone TorD
MSTNATTIDAPLAQLAAREHVLRLLSLAASDPAAERFAHADDERLTDLACSAARYLAEDPGAAPDELAPGETPPSDFDLGSLMEALRAPRARLEEDHARVFGLVVSKECPPYEVQYCPQTFSVYRSQRLADVAGFYHAFGVEPGRDAPERADHIASELEFLAWLVSKERHARSQEGDEWTERARICRDAQRDFVTEHMAWWVPAFAQALAERARSLDPRPALHEALAEALAAFVPVERAILGVGPPDVLARPQLDQDESEDGCGGCSGGSGAS